MEKACTKCGLIKPISDFSPKKGSKLGFASACRVCKRKTDKKVFQKFRKKRLGQMHEHFENNRTKYYAMAKKMNEKYPEKKAARTAVRNAITKGVLKRGKCAFCSDPKTQGHHNDYSKPLEVVWLCITCHKLLHVIIRSLAAKERRAGMEEVTSRLPEKLEIINPSGLPRNSGMHSENARRKGWNECLTAARAVLNQEPK